MHGTTSIDRLTWDDLPALLLTTVSAVTVTSGAQLLRGQNPMLMLLLGIGVAGATFVLDRLLVQRLNSIRPQQSLPGLLFCWVPLFLFATALATFATFSWTAPAIARQDLDEARRQHWTDESDKIRAYAVALTAAVRKESGTTQGEIDAERRRAAIARREGAEYSPEPLRAAQRRLASMRELERNVAGLQRPPIDPPDDGGQTALEGAFRGVEDLHATAASLLQAAPARPTYHPLMPPSSDLPSVVMEETRKGTWRALTAWGAALWVEVLPLLALWRGGRKATLAARVLQWRTRVTDTCAALRGRHTPVALPIVIEPLNVRGIVRVAAPNDYTLTDCSALLDEAIATLTGVLGSYRVNRVSNVRGDDLDEGSPLLPQLNGQPLVLSVQECRP
jgi:hypothetical protein